jgi:hypothetical protein
MLLCATQYGFAPERYRLSASEPRSLVASVFGRCTLALALYHLSVLAHAQVTESDPAFHSSVARPEYTRVHPRVVIDQAHHNYHTMEGRYLPFAELLTSDGYEVLPGNIEFNASEFSSVSVLVIANARGGATPDDAAKPAFSASECDAVEGWVRNGGALLLIADHTPFGSAAHDLALRFGVDMGRGYVFDPQHADGNPTFLVFSADNGLLGNHAVLRGHSESEQVHRIVAFTGQSLSIPTGATALMRLAPSAFEVDSFSEGAAILSSSSNGHDLKTARDLHFRSDVGRAQGVALAFGRGRLVVVGEAALFSAQILRAQGEPDFRFGMNTPGNDDKQFVLNTLHWLSGSLF